MLKPTNNRGATHILLSIFLLLIVAMCIYAAAHWKSPVFLDENNFTTSITAVKKAAAADVTDELDREKVDFLTNELAKIAAKYDRASPRSQYKL